MVINKLTKRWCRGESLQGNYLISVGRVQGEEVLLIHWPQEYDEVLTYVRHSDLNSDDPVHELWRCGVDPDWIVQDELPVEYIPETNALKSFRYRLNR